MNIRKINRGLLLGAVLVLGVAGYEVGQRISFKNSIPEIKDTAAAYIQELAESSVGEPGSVSHKGKAAVEHCFTSYTVPEGVYGNSKKEMMQNLEYIGERSGQIYSVDCQVKDTRVKKSGPNSAMVKVSFELNAGCTGRTSVLTPGSAVYIDEETDHTWDYTTSCETEMLMVEKEGDWKIAYANTYYYLSSSTVAEGEGEVQG